MQGSGDTNLCCFCLVVCCDSVKESIVPLPIDMIAPAHSLTSGIFKPVMSHQVSSKHCPSAYRHESSCTQSHIRYEMLQAFYWCTKSRSQKASSLYASVVIAPAHNLTHEARRIHECNPKNAYEAAPVREPTLPQPHIHTKENNVKTAYERAHKHTQKHWVPSES